MVTPCRSPIRLEVSREGTAATARGGLVLLFELLAAQRILVGLPRSVGSPAQGWSDAQMILAVLVLDVAGLERVSDIEPLETDAGPCALVALALAALAMPAQAQFNPRDTRVLMPAPRYVTSLRANLVDPAPRFVGRTWTGVVRNLKIEALPDSQGRMTFGVGSGSRCAYGAGDTDDRVVEFHNADGTWSRGEAIAEACPQWGPAKCSRTVTVDLREHGQGMHTFTFNRGYPACPSSWGDDSNNIEGGSNNEDRAPALGDAADDVPDSRQDIRARDGTERRSSRRGIFRVRIWGNLCVFGGRACRSFKDGAAKSLATGDLRIINAGYAATFRPAGHCGPRSWPTPAWQAAGAPAHAEWCDVTVDVRR